MEPTIRAREMFFNQQKQKEINDALGEQELFANAPSTDEVKLALQEQELSWADCKIGRRCLLLA